MTFRVSSLIGSTAPYAFAEVDKQVAALRAKGVRVIDFGVGDPREPTPPFVIDALKHGADTHAASGYPSYEGSPSFRRACADYMHTTFGVTLDPDREIIATIGSKEAVFHFPFGIIEPGDIVLCPTPGYPPYKTGTRFARGVPYFVPLLSENDFLIDFEAIPQEIRMRARILWTNYPNSPTGATASRSWLSELHAWAQENDIIIAADEGCYIDLYSGDKPVSMLEVAREGVLAFYSLSKRNNMTGYRVGFCAGDERLVSAIRTVKTNADSGVPWFVQEAAIAALNDTEHITSLRKDYAEKRRILTAALTKAGLPACTADATFYLWQKAPSGMTGIDLSRKLLDLGIVVTPGEWISDTTENSINPGRDYVRFALIASMDDIRETERRLEEALMLR
ncbi:MAG: aminotransferase class I/II-fold pyridoxal phosphate-dependent enzyme [Candidatus Peregrinibacteria bacterium]